MIYFLQDSATLHIKIGYTANDPLARLADLQTGNPSPLILLAAVEGALADEAALHREFAAARVAGEWFNPTPALLRHILVLATRENGSIAYSEGFAAGKIADSAAAHSPVFIPDTSWGNYVSEGQNSPTLLVHCPVCGFDYNHVAGTEKIYGYESGYGWPGIERPPEGALKWAGCGNGTAIEMWCENGHRWLFCLGFHKGQTSFFTRSNPRPDPEFDAQYADAPLPAESATDHPVG